MHSNHVIAFLHGVRHEISANNIIQSAMIYDIRDEYLLINDPACVHASSI